MRRPNLCNNSVTVADDSYKPNSAPKEEDVRRLSLMRRVLGGNSKKKEHQPKVFGTPLAELKATSNSVPVILNNLCVFIEIHGLNVEGLWRGGCNSTTLDELKNRLIKDACADIEPSSDVNAVALLLLVWLGELPQPLIPQQTTSDLISIMKKYPDENCWFSESLLTLGIVRHNSLEVLLHLLHCYTNIHPSALTYIPSVFAPLITPAYFASSTQDLVTRLIVGYTGIFKHRSIKMEIVTDNDVDGMNKNNKQRVSVTPDQNQKQRKRKERQDSTSMDKERKFVRSNSEERPCGVNSESTACGDNIDNIRRVSSHEDFSKSRNKAETPQMRKLTQPLHERNSCSPTRQRDNTLQLTNTVGYASELYDESEHERRRNSERFAPQVRHRRTKHYRSSSQAKENESGGLKMKNSSRHAKSKTFIFENITTTTTEINEVKDKPEEVKNNCATEEEDRSPSPISGVSSPTLDMKTFHEANNEPVTSWNTMLPPSEERLVSPRNSIVMTKRTFTNVQREDDPSFLELTLQINNLKQKMRKYEDGFEKEFGFKPSHEDKMANPDTKRICVMLSKLRKQLKNTREECSKLIGLDKSKPVIKEDVVKEIEKKLKEKRVYAGREENIEDMGPEEVVEEKCAMQKALLGLEATYGRPHSKEERELVRSLYERYRSLKRALLRHAPSKVKESVSELGTIHEHETMEFTLPLPRAISPGVLPQPARPSSPTPMADDEPNSAEPATESLLADLHALPPHELLELARTTREEKKRLRRSLREYEQEFEAKTGRKPYKQDRHPLDSLYADYKNAKAKLRFIDALVTKIK